jgi:uncharacterized protein (TIGR03437 family)
MLRFLISFAIIPFSFSQNLPALRWVQQVDNSGADTFAGLGTDAQGNIYVAGSTLSPNFQVKSPIQTNLGSAGVYRIDGPGSAYTRIGLNSVMQTLTADPKNPNVIYGAAVGTGQPAIKSVDGGNTWTALSIPTTDVVQFTVDPSNSQNVYAAAFDIGFLKSTDGGATWNLVNNGITACTHCAIQAGQLGARNIWIDPNNPNVVFGFYGFTLARSTDGAASWQTVGPTDTNYNLYFDTHHPGVLYLFTPRFGSLKSTDDGQTFQGVSIPVNAIFADPNQAGRLVGSALTGIFESTDDGATWTLAISISGMAIVAADWANGYLYAATVPPTSNPSGILQISSDLKTKTLVGPPGITAQGLIVDNGHVYVPNSGGHNAFVAKLDASGNVIYSTYFGGSGDDTANAMTVDAAGNVYVTGTTSSLDFPVTKGAYSTSAPTSSRSVFLFKLNPDGTVGYSTYFPTTGNTGPAAVAVDAAGSVYVGGYTNGGIPTTPGAYKTICGCTVVSTGFLVFFESDAFLTKFDPTGSSLVYSTYLGVPEAAGRALALGADGSAYLASGMSYATTVYHMNATGSSLLATATPFIDVQSMAVAADGGLYMAGSSFGTQFHPTAGAFQTTGPPPALPYQSSVSAVLMKMDAQLQNVLAATYFGGPYGPAVGAMAIDAAGNVCIAGGSPPRGLPTRTLLFEAFSPSAGFLSEFSSDLSTLLFSTYLGDAEAFSIKGVALGSSGSVVVGGSTLGQMAMSIYVNSLLPAAPPALRVDAIQNAASLVDGPLSPGETIVVRGAGFGSDAQLIIGGAVVPALSMTATQITAVVPSNLPSAVAVQVQSGGSASNLVVIPVATASPGLFSADGSGMGQGYILNQDGTLNSTANPAKIGDRITIFATGIGPVSLTDCCAVTSNPVNVFVEGFYCNGVAAVMGPVAGFSGSVYQLTVIVPNPVTINPDLKNFVFPPQVGVVLQVAGGFSQNALSISIAP